MEKKNHPGYFTQLVLLYCILYYKLIINYMIIIYNRLRNFLSRKLAQFP
jgi:hypothetical protein